MSKGSRWQPPYPDPAKALKVYIADTPVSERRIKEEARATQDSRRANCNWAGCFRHQTFRTIRMGIPLCETHVMLVVDAWVADCDALVEAEAERAAKTAAKIDAGKPLSKGEYIPGWVYYVEIDGLIKIGYSTDVRRRMRAYPPSARLLAVEPGTEKLERMRHDHFGAYLARGREWFRDSDEMRTWVAGIRAEHGDADHLAHRWTGDREPVGAKRMNRRHY